MKGDILSDQNVEIHRPATGIDARFYTGLLGAKVVKNIQKGHPVSWEMIATSTV